MFRMGLIISIMILTLVACQSESSSSEKDQQTVDSLPGLAALTEKIEKDPQNAELYFNRADLYLRNGQFEEGIEDLEAAIGEDSSAAYFYMRLADVYLEAEDPSNDLPDSRKAIEALQRYLNKYPENEQVRKRLAEIYLVTQQYDEAINELNVVIAQKTFNPDAHFKKGMVLKYAGDTTRALQQFQKATEQDPELFEAYMQMGLLTADKNLDLAKSYFENALSVKPDSKEAQYALAKVLQDAEKFEEAKEVYRKMVTTSAQDEKLFFNLGYIYYEQDSLDKAERQFEIAIKLDPAYGQAYYARGIVRETKGNFAEAIRDYENALRVDPEHPYAEEALNELKKKM